jgi:methyltransferase (TIGR00027 family)
MALQGFDAVAKTALLTAALRTKESARPDRLYDDPYANALAGDVGQALFDEVARMTVAKQEVDATGAAKVPNTFDYNAIRTRFLDDWLTTTVDAGGFDQVVIAAAGMDTRAYRLTWPHPVRVYEIDRPAVLDLKRAALAEHPTADNVTRIPVRSDLLDDDWRADLVAAEFDPTRPAVWLLEGVLYYLPEAGVRGLLTELEQFCRPGSPLACDMINEVAITSPATRQLLQVFADLGSPWVSGSDDPEQLMTSYGFDVVAVQPGEPGADYGRWQAPVFARDVPNIPRVFYVHGKRAC